jgi:hypothetical protein
MPVAGLPDVMSIGKVFAPVPQAQAPTDRQRAAYMI